jgi:hypothetical protein
MTHRLLYRLLILAVLLLLLAAVVYLRHWLDTTSRLSDALHTGWRNLLLELALSIVFLSTGTYIWPTVDDRFLRYVWLAGLIAFGLLRVLHVVLLPDHATLWRITLHLPLTLASLPLMIWLMHRYSHITRPWSHTAARVLTGWLLISGILLCINTNSLSGWLRWMTGAVIMLAHIISAAHCYRALSDRNESRTLAAHWHAHAVLTLLVMTGFFGAVRAVSSALLADTSLESLPEVGKSAALIALSLGLINQIVAEMRGQRWRVTGLLPFWTVAAGMWFWLFTLAAIGIVQISFVRIGYTESPADLLPLTRFAAGAWALILIGLVIYSLGLYARRVRFDEPA